LIELIHTGDDPVQVVGMLREVPKGVRVFGVAKSQERAQAHPSKAAAALFGGLFLSGGLATFVVIAFDLESPPSMLFLAGLFGVTFIGLGALFLWSLRGIAAKNLSARITSGAAPSTRLPWHRRLYRRRNKD
jgi:hypothetical protein